VTAENLLLWGFQGTIDYRCSIDAGIFHRLFLPVPQEDEERFITRTELEETVRSLERFGVEVLRTPGGSPLVSALAAASWHESRDDPTIVPRFVGAIPQDLPALVPEHRRPVLGHATASAAIAGTLALEHEPTSAKLMLSVPDGRWLDEALACVAMNGIKQSLIELQPRRALLGFGGLNKSTPSIAGELVRQVRSLVDDCIIFVSGNSFRKTPASVPDYWSDLYQVLGSADVISVSREEWGQLSDRWGSHWAQDLFAGHRTRFVYMHWPEGSSVLAAPGSKAVLADPAHLCQVASARATEYAARALTGLGARFDGVLSALVRQSWRRLD
jgi:hypothetical protein